MNFKRPKSWGEEIWDDKAKVQKEIGVIQGVAGSEKSISETTKKVMSLMDNEFLPLVKKGKILDVGVGPLARFSMEFSKRGYKVTGVDISQTTLNYARKHIEDNKVKGIDLVKDDLIELKKIKGKYDVVFCAGTFGHIPSFLAMNTMKSFNRVLNDGGFCIIDFWVKDDINFFKVSKTFVYNILRLIKKQFKKTFDVNCSFYTIEEVEELTKMSGFKIIKRNDNYFLLKKIN